VVLGLADREQDAGVLPDSSPDDDVQLVGDPALGAWDSARGGFEGESAEGPSAREVHDPFAAQVLEM
jgi:hypothetical protein